MELTSNEKIGQHFADHDFKIPSAGDQVVLWPWPLEWSVGRATTTTTTMLGK